MGADAAAADSVEAPPAGELLPDELGVVPAGLDVSHVSAVGSESGRRITQARWVYLDVFKSHFIVFLCFWRQIFSGFLSFVGFILHTDSLQTWFMKCGLTVFQKKSFCWWWHWHHLIELFSPPDFRDCSGKSSQQNSASLFISVQCCSLTCLAEKLNQLAFTATCHHPARRCVGQSNKYKHTILVVCNVNAVFLLFTSMKDRSSLWKLSRVIKSSLWVLETCAEFWCLINRLTH